MLAITIQMSFDTSEKHMSVWTRTHWIYIFASEQFLLRCANQSRCVLDMEPLRPKRYRSWLHSTRVRPDTVTIPKSTYYWKAAYELAQQQQLTGRNYSAGLQAFVLIWYFSPQSASPQDDADHPTIEAPEEDNWTDADHHSSTVTTGADGANIREWEPRQGRVETPWYIP